MCVYINGYTCVCFNSNIGECKSVDTICYVLLDTLEYTVRHVNVICKVQYTYILPFHFYNNSFTRCLTVSHINP